MASVSIPLYTTTDEASQAAFMNSKSFSRSFPKALPISLSF
jgi:hypothetical protein